MKTVFILLFLSLNAMAGYSGGGGGSSWPPEYNIGNSGSSFAVNWTNGTYQRVTLTNNFASCTLSGAQDGGQYFLRVIQDSTGSRTLGLPYPMIYGGGVGVQWATCPGCWDDIEFLYRGTTYTVIKHQLYDPNAAATVY